MLDVRFGEFHEEFHCFLLHLPTAEMVRVLTALLDRKICVVRVIQPSCSTHGEVGAWRVGNHQIPLLTLGKEIIITVFEMTSFVLDHFQNILMEVPFGMSAAAFQNVAAVSIMSSLSESLANGLALFTSY